MSQTLDMIIDDFYRMQIYTFLSSYKIFQELLDFVF
jgi:hypothetical protein